MSIPGHRPGRRFALFALGALAFPVLVATPTHAEVSQKTGIRILDAPTSRADDPRARLYIVDHLAPGTTIHRRVEVSNDTDSSQAFQLYAAAATVDDSGFEFGEGRAANELTGWTTVDPPALTLGPRSKRTATVTIAVPRRASAGERYAVVWEEVRAPAPAGGGITMVNRAGVRVYLSVGPGGDPPSDFSVESVTGRREADGTPVVVASVRNTGGRALDISGDVSLSHGPALMTAGPFPLKTGLTLGLGEAGTVTALLDPALPDGPWDVTLQLRSGTVERTGAATIAFRSGPGESGVPENSVPAPADAAVGGPTKGTARLRTAAIVGAASMIGVTTGAAITVLYGGGSGGFAFLGLLPLARGRRRRSVRRR